MWRRWTGGAIPQGTEASRWINPLSMRRTPALALAYAELWSRSPFYALGFSWPDWKEMLHSAHTINSLTHPHHQNGAERQIKLIKWITYLA
jgi:hypothetical protein